MATLRVPYQTLDSLFNVLKTNFLSPIVHTPTIYFLQSISNHIHTSPHAFTPLLSKINQEYLFRELTPRF